MKTTCAWLVAAILLLGLAASADAAAAPSASAADAATPDPAAPADYADAVISNEHDTSKWAFVTRKVIAYSQPKNQGSRVRKLTTRTPDGTNELVLVLVERSYNDGSVWAKVRLPMRGSGRTGWVRRGALGIYNTVHTRLEINRRRFTAKLYKNEVLIWSARVGVGKKGLSTPAGDFYIRDRLVSTQPHGVYGPYAFGLSAYSSHLSDWPGGGIIGIHGTNQPGLIPGRISHGCIRVKNSKIRRLYKLMPAGTPVKIL